FPLFHKKDCSRRAGVADAGRAPDSYYRALSHTMGPARKPGDSNDRFPPNQDCLGEPGCIALRLAPNGFIDNTSSVPRPPTRCDGSAAVAAAPTGPGPTCRSPRRSTWANWEAAALPGWISTRAPGRRPASVPRRTSGPAAAKKRATVRTEEPKPTIGPPAPNTEWSE